MWHEICTTAQEHTELLAKDKKVNPYKFEGETGIPMSKSASPRSPIEASAHKYESDRLRDFISKKRFN